MMCPNKNHPDWKALEATYGTTQAFRYWMAGLDSQSKVDGYIQPKVADESFMQLDIQKEINPAIEALDNYLLDFLKAFNVKTKQFDELKSRLGVNALGATDVLNKLIWYVKNRNEETIPEEAAHMLVALMGINHPDIEELIENITSWSEYENIKNEYLPIYKDEDKVKVEAIGKLISKALVKNYKANGLDKGKLQKALDSILNFIESILDSLNFTKAFYYNQSIADHIAINVLSGNKNYIYEIKNLNPNLNAEEEINNNPNAKNIINKFSSANVKMTGSLAIAATENIRRPQGQGIHDLDFKVKSFDVYKKEVIPKLPNNAVPAHYGWHKKTYSTFAYLIPLKGYRIKVLERKSGFSNGWIKGYELYDSENKKVPVTQSNVVSVDFFVYKDGIDQKDFDFSSEFAPASLVYEGKISLGGKSNNYFFSRDKDQEDYVLRNPKSFIPFEKHIYYQLPDKDTTQPEVEDPTKYKKIYKGSELTKPTNPNNEMSLEGFKEGQKGVYEVFEENRELLESEGITAEMLIKSISKNKNSISDIENWINNCLKGRSTNKANINTSSLPKAEQGMKSSKFTKGGTWKIIKDLQGYPTHEKGGVDLMIGKDGVSITSGQSNFKAEYGLVLPKTQSKSTSVNMPIMQGGGVIGNNPNNIDNEAPPFDYSNTVMPRDNTNVVILQENYDDLNEEKEYIRFKNTLPPNLRDTDETYDMKYLWKHGGKPKSFEESINREDPMFGLGENGKYRGHTVEPNTNRFVKRSDHETIQKELNWYYSEEGAEFRSKFDLDKSGEFYRYVLREE